MKENKKVGTFLFLLNLPFSLFMLQLCHLKAAFYIRLIFKLIIQTLLKKTTIIHQESFESVWVFGFVVLLGGVGFHVFGVFFNRQRVCILSHLTPF